MEERELSQRWTSRKKSAIVIEILKGSTTAQEVARQNGLTVAEVESWKDKFLHGAENALRTKPKDDAALQEEQVKKLERKVGQLVMTIDILNEATKGYPSMPGTSDE